MIEVRWHGRGGQGGFTVSRILGMAASLFNDKHAIAFPSFGPERRGAPVLAFTKIDDTKINDRSEVEACDFVIIMDETLIGDSITSGIKSSAKIIINTTKPEKYVNSFAKENKIFYLDATQIALDVLKRPITNTIMLGALVAISDIADLDSCKKSIDQELNPKIIEKNKQVLTLAYEQVKEFKNS